MLREAVVVALAVIAAPIVARAQSADVVEEAGRRFQKGLADYDGGDYAAAYAEFQRAYELTKRWEVLFNLGVTEKKLFRYRDAIHTLERYLHEGGDAVPPERRAEVVAAKAEIRGLVADVIVVVDGAPAVIEVDGHAEGSTPIGEPLLLTSGHHVITAARGVETDRKEIDVQSGNKVDIRLVPRAPDRTAKLTIRSAPVGATLTLDQRTLGRAPWSGRVDKGGHKLGASLDGRLDVQQEIVVDTGQDRDYLLELPERPRAWYNHWYVAAAIGAIVIAGGIVLYAETQTNPDVIVKYP